MLYASCNRCNVLCRAIVNEHGNDSLPVWGLYAPVLMKIGPEELRQALWLSHLRFFQAHRRSSGAAPPKAGTSQWNTSLDLIVALPWFCTLFLPAPKKQNGRANV